MLTNSAACIGSRMIEFMEYALQATLFQCLSHEAVFLD